MLLMTSFQTSLIIGKNKFKLVENKKLHSNESDILKVENDILLNIE